jgi:hypothetical protein
MSGQEQWAKEYGRKAVSGLLIGFGILFMVLTQLIFTKLSKFGFVLSICFIATGAVIMFKTPSPKR